MGCLVVRGSVSAELGGSLFRDPLIPEWIKFFSEELSDEGVSVGRYFRVGGDETSCWRTCGWRPGWHCTGWPEWFAGISRGESLQTFMNLYVDCLVLLLHLGSGASV